MNLCIAALAGVGLLVAGVDGRRVTKVEVPSIVVILVDCNCTPKLKTEVSCGAWPELVDEECITVDVADGVANSPKCNAVANCEQLVNCDSGVGQALVTFNSEDNWCAICNRIEVQKDGVVMGTITSVGVGMAVPVGGTAVACTNMDNTEGTGEVLAVYCLGSAPAPHCTFTIKDTCKKCPG